MKKTLIASLGALALMGMSARSAVVEVDYLDDDRAARPKDRAQKMAQAERLQDHLPAPKEKSAGLKRMLARKGRA